MTTGHDLARPMIVNLGSSTGDASLAGTDGATSSDGLVKGTYLHGIFDSPEALQALLEWAGLRSDTTVNLEEVREKQLERLANAFESAIDMDKLIELLEQTG
ncbi:hypothetical protein A3761_24840 [Oleiphilus sp. HI0123]|nr:hypothetical protein A3761_24840 [Oleiphilus sp. HI0123]